MKPRFVGTVLFFALCAGAIADDVAKDLKESVSAGGLAFPIESHLLLAYA